MSGQKGEKLAPHTEQPCWNAGVSDPQICCGEEMTGAEDMGCSEEKYYLHEDSFTNRVYDVVKQIPSGHVATYGQIAALAGNPRAARAVGNALHRNPDERHVPCFRVVDSQGRLSGAFAFGGIDVQRERLEEDGIEVVNMRVDLKEYGWRP